MRARGIVVTRIHGMDESGVQSPSGPPSIFELYLSYAGFVPHYLIIKEYGNLNTLL